MPQRPATTEIRSHDLRACTDVPSIFDLFSRLHYPVDFPPIAIPLDPHDVPERLQVGIAARYQIAQVGGKHPGDPRITVTLLVLKNPRQNGAAFLPRQSDLMRGIAQNWTRQFPGHHLSVFTIEQEHEQDGFEHLTFINARRVGEGATLRIKLHKLIVDRRHPTRHDLETLNRIALPPEGLSADELYQAHCEAFDVERVTRAFFREYAHRFQEAMERIRQSNPQIAAFRDATRLHAFTQRLFGRLLFLYFLQKKGALAGNRSFLKDWYEETARQGEVFYHQVLEPLFFDILNKPRPEHQSRFGRIPYLNGGLFASDEDDHVGQAHLANELFDTRSPDGLLYFFNNHNFTIEEDTPLEVEVAQDPEMLGRVFENLLETGERGRSGTYYTPRSIVNLMCREALAAYLARETGLEEQKLDWLLEEAETGEPAQDEQGQPRLTNHTLPYTLRERLDRALDRVRVVDPAVGSGAFLLGMLALLVGVRRSLHRIAGVSVRLDSQLVEGWKRTFIRDCLYGVDIKHEAIEIARLRLWLSLVVDADLFEMEPLPNLDFKLVAGDSLIETINGTVIYPTRPTAESQTSQLTLIESETQQLIHRLRALKDEYFQPLGGRPAREIKEEILQTERQIVLQALHEREQQQQFQLDKLLNTVVKVVPDRNRNTEIETLRREIETTRQAIGDLEAGQTLPLFLYRLHFASVFEEKDGFDIVIANPPYVRHERVPKETLLALRAAYPAVQHSSADLYVYFYARALELLRQSGSLAFISSNKFFRAGYGKGLRDLLASQTQIQIVLDLNDAPVFEATTDPCVVITAKDHPAAHHAYRGLAASSTIDLEKLSAIFVEESQILVQAQGIRPPSSGAGITSALIERMERLGTPLGQYIEGEIYRGVLTGLNEAFVIDQATRDRLIAEDPRSAEILKPFLRGRHVQRYKLNPEDIWLIFTRRGINITHYPAIERHLAQFKKELQPRQPGVEGPGRKPGTYKWYEIQDSIEYYRAFEGPKIVYPVIALSRKFAFDKAGYYSNDKTFVLPVEDYYLLGFLNSKCAWSWIKEKCPVLGNPNNRGRFELRDTVMKHLPIPIPTPKQKARIEELAEKLVKHGTDIPEAAAWEAEIDQIVYQMFDLTPEEIAEVECQAQLGAGRRGQQVVADEEVEG